MRLPSKVTSYRRSVFALFPKILRELQNGPVPAPLLYHSVIRNPDDAADFFDALNCLYALRAIDLEGDDLIHVG